MKLIKWKSKTWEDEYLIRRSKWLLYFYIVKSIFLVLLAFFLTYFILKLEHTIWETWDKKYIVYALWLLLWVFIVYISIKIPIYFIRFFYELEIINKELIYKLNIWIFHKDDISIINLNNIQEVKAISEWLFKILFKISDIQLVELRDQVKVIHFLDYGKDIANLILEFKNHENDGIWNKIVE